MTREQELQEAFLRDREAKRIKEEGTIASPLSDVINKRKKGKGITTHRTIYERKYLKENIGKQCYYCKDTLTEENILIKSNGAHGGRNKDKLYCVKCAMLESKDRGIVSRLGHKALTELKELTERLDKYRHKLNHTKHLVRLNASDIRALTKRHERYYSAGWPKQEINGLNIEKNNLNLDLIFYTNECDKLKNEISLIRYGIPKETKVVIEDKVTPFRSEEDFDF